MGDCKVELLRVAARRRGKVGVMPPISIQIRGGGEGGVSGGEWGCQWLGFDLQGNKGDGVAWPAGLDARLG